MRRGGSRVRRWAAIEALAVPAAILAPTLLYPLARDQGVFAFVGSALLRGEIPYRDVWEIKPPAIYWTYAAILATLGGSSLAVHFADLLVGVGVSFCLYALVRR